MLRPRGGERILDLGCGNGRPKESIEAQFEIFVSARKR
jgi:cyclopropane fatty-acyl-phospholipid synthase-like methyltransferase